MQKFFQYISMFIFIIFVSCEKEIDVTVDDAEPKVVVEAKMSNREGDASVKLTQSLNLNDDEAFPRITGAEVTIIDVATQTTYMLTETEEGFYNNPTLTGESGKTYALNIILSNGTQLSASDTMADMVELTNVEVESVDNPFGEDDDEAFFELEPQFVDIADQDNYYQLVIMKGDSILEQIDVFKDLGFDGLPNSQSIFIDASPQDTIQIDLHNLSLAAYTYLFGVNQALEQASATPTNPESNITGDALGYFKVYAVGETYEIVLPESSE